MEIIRIRFGNIRQNFVGQIGVRGGRVQAVTEAHWVHSLVYTQILEHLRKSRTNPNREATPTIYLLEIERV